MPCGAAARASSVSRSRGLEPVLPDFRYRAIDASGIVENEICPVFRAVVDADPQPAADEVAEWEWATPAHVRAAVEATPFAFSPWLVLQLASGQFGASARSSRTSRRAAATALTVAATARLVAGGARVGHRDVGAVEVLERPGRRRAALALVAVAVLARAVGVVDRRAGADEAQLPDLHARPELDRQRRDVRRARA